MYEFGVFDAKLLHAAESYAFSKDGETDFAGVGRE